MTDRDEILADIAARRRPMHADRAAPGRSGPPCTCDACRADPFLLTGVREHKYCAEAGTDEHGWQRWRWACTCGRRGRWQSQSPGVAYHRWRTHMGLDGAFRRLAEYDATGGDPDQEES